MNCSCFDENINAYVDGEMSSTEAEACRVHVAECTDCECAVARMQQTRALLSTAIADSAMAVDVSDLWANVEKALGPELAGRAAEGLSEGRAGVPAGKSAASPVRRLLGVLGIRDPSAETSPEGASTGFGLTVWGPASAAFAAVALFLVSGVDPDGLSPSGSVGGDLATSSDSASAKGLASSSTALGTPRVAAPDSSGNSSETPTPVRFAAQGRSMSSVGPGTVQQVAAVSRPSAAAGSRAAVGRTGFPSQRGNSFGVASARRPVPEFAYSGERVRVDSLSAGPGHWVSTWEHRRHDSAPATRVIWVSSNDGNSGGRRLTGAGR